MLSAASFPNYLRGTFVNVKPLLYGGKVLVHIEPHVSFVVVLMLPPGAIVVPDRGQKYS